MLQLVHNGFVFSGNQSDCLTLKLGISKNDALAAAKYALLDRLNIPRNGTFYVCRDNDKPIDDLVLAFLRVITMNSKEELDKWIEMDQQDPGKVAELLSDKVFDASLDKRAYQYLETRYKMSFSSFIKNTLY